MNDAQQLLVVEQFFVYHLIKQKAPKKTPGPIG